MGKQNIHKRRLPLPITFSLICETWYRYGMSPVLIQFNFPTPICLQGLYCHRCKCMFKWTLPEPGHVQALLFSNTIQNLHCFVIASCIYNYLSCMYCTWVKWTTCTVLLLSCLYESSLPCMRGRRLMNLGCGPLVRWYRGVIRYVRERVLHHSRLPVCVRRIYSIADQHPLHNAVAITVHVANGIYINVVRVHTTIWFSAAVIERYKNEIILRIVLNEIIRH